MNCICINFNGHDTMSCVYIIPFLFVVQASFTAVHMVRHY